MKISWVHKSIVWNGLSVVKAFCGNSPKVEWWSGLGLMVSSITMTVFYVLLFYIWRAVFPGVMYPAALPVLIWLSAVIRIVLCLFPQNNWFRTEGNLKWGIYRNLPFAVTGLCLVILFFLSGNTGGYGLWWIVWAAPPEKTVPAMRYDLGMLDIDMFSESMHLGRVMYLAILRQNFGFDLENGITKVALDLAQEHYYLEGSLLQSQHIPNSEGVIRGVMLRVKSPYNNR